MTKPGWGVIVKGDDAPDLGRWANASKEAYALWVEIHGDQTVIRSTSLDELASADEVRDRAVALIERLNGALALSQHAPIRFDSVIRFAPDGGIHRTMFAESAMLAVSGMPVDSTVIGPDGKPRPPPPPQPSEIQRWAVIAEGNDLLDHALRYFGKGADWPNIYKALECLYQRANGWHAFLALNWEPEEEVKRLKYSADWARKWVRHPKATGNPPKDPMSLKDAHALLGRLLSRALRDAIKP
jgi:hypothetical protein